MIPLGVVDVRVVVLPSVRIRCKHLRESTHPCDHLGLDALADSPLDPLVGIGFADGHGHQAVTAMCLQVIAHPVGRQVARQEHDAVLVQADITQAWIGFLQHRVQHVLNRVGTLGELVEHHHHRLALVHIKAGIWVIPCSLTLVIDYRHCDVTQVHIGYVNIRVSKTHACSDHLQQGGLTDTGLALQEEPGFGVAANQIRSLLERDALTK